MSVAIEIRDLVRQFGKQTVLNGINLDIHEGETMVIMGGSGCGKSTLLRHLIGSLKPTSGTIKLFGHDLSSLDEAGLDKVRSYFGILFQSGALFNSMTVAENVALPLREHTELDGTTIDIMVKIKLEQVGLREHAEKFPSQISGGMKKRAGLARALALDPRILFYDEPSAGLDPVPSAEIDQLMLDLTRKLGVTSVVVTHEMGFARRVADRIDIIAGGRLVEIGPPEQLGAQDLFELPDPVAHRTGRHTKLFRCLRHAAQARQRFKRQQTLNGRDACGHVAPTLRRCAGRCPWERPGGETAGGHNGRHG
jgi:phospholipid/cholesterol/gamma-HCH transport system ATP-binding protein